MDAIPSAQRRTRRGPVHRPAAARPPRDADVDVPPTDGTWPGRRGKTVVLALALYLVLAVALWWNVWSANPTQMTSCGCGDAARTLWFFEWPAYALTHGHAMVWSNWLNHPVGINLLNDASVLGVTLPMAPLTLALGPVLAMNLALTAAPVASALAMCVLCQRFVSRSTIAVLVGLAFGFSPFLIDPVAVGQLNLAFLAGPPLIALLLEDILRTRRLRPVVAGVLLAGVVALQFFVSVEILLITALCATAVVVPLALVMRGADRSVRRHVCVALGTAAGASVALLVVPLWLYAAGRAHLTGPIWSGAQIWLLGTTPGSLVSSIGSSFEMSIQHTFGSHRGHLLPSSSYLGVSVVIIALGGLLLRRRDGVVQLLGAVGLASALAAMTPLDQPWAPWRLLRHLPMLDNVVESRFIVVTLLCALLIAGRTIDGLWSAALLRWRRAPRWSRGLAGALAIVAMLLPNVLVLAPVLPLSANPVATPLWFRTVGTTLRPTQVLLVYPDPASGRQASQAWQATTGMHWKQAGVGGPAGSAARGGPAVAALAAAGTPLGPAPVLAGATSVAAMRSALRSWGVTMIVVPNQHHLGVNAAGRPTGWAVAYFTAITASRPTHEADAWVWRLQRPLPPPSSQLTARVTPCTSPAPGTVDEVLACMWR